MAKALWNKYFLLSLQKQLKELNYIIYLHLFKNKNKNVFYLSYFILLHI